MGFKGQRFGRYVLERKQADVLAGEVWKGRGDDASGGAGAAGPGIAIAIFGELACAEIAHRVPLPRTPVHANVAQVFGGDFQASPPYLVTELVPGATLRELIDALKYVPLAGAIPAAIQIVRGLAALHKAGLAHLDLRPENVAIDERGRLKLLEVMPLDYRKALVARALEKKVSTQHPERVASLIAYLPPEQRRATFDGPKGDMWQLGLLLYEMLTGKRPEGFDAPYPSQVDKRIPKILDEVCFRCMEKVLRARQADASALEPVLVEGLAKAGFELVLAGDPARWVQKTPWQPNASSVGEETGRFRAIFDKLTAPRPG